MKIQIRSLLVCLLARESKAFISPQINTKASTYLFSTQENAPSEKTLYEILNSSPDATRSEIKRKYVELVRTSHPDARIGMEDSTYADEQFQLYTNAWKTLSNPLERKRYDRELRAKKFAQDVEDVIGNVGENIGPKFMQAFDSIAVPFLRRSTAATVAGINAVQEDLKNYSSKKEQRSNSFNGETTDESIGIGAILSNAVNASQKGLKAIDQMELLEKSQELKKRARDEYMAANRLRDELDEVMRRRVQLTLHTPNAKLSSLEAMIILDGMNTVDEVGLVESLVRLRKTVTYEIEQLQIIENTFSQKYEEDRQIVFEIEQKIQALEQAKKNAAAAIEAEEKARKALEDARNLVRKTNEEVDSTLAALGKLDDVKNASDFELRRIEASMEKQQERMRLALRRKEQEVEGQKSEDGKMKGDFKNDMALTAATEVESLLKEEHRLRSESITLQAKAERLESRSQKLMERADEIEQQEEEAYKALEEGLRVAKDASDRGYTN